MTDDKVIEILESYSPCANCPSSGYDCEVTKCLILEALAYCKDVLKQRNSGISSDLIEIS